ncbi:type VI secretion system baseplate subunit TssK [Massilia sp. SR12]
MTLPAKVLWSERCFLRPQHFQQQDRYHEARLHATALANGKLRLLAGSDPLPAEVQEVTYYAAMPAHDADRFAQAERETADLFSDALPAGLTYLRRQVRLVSDREPHAAYDRFAPLHLRRLVVGSVETDPLFMPPSRSIGATPLLKLLLEQLIDALQAKAGALQEERPCYHTGKLDSGKFGAPDNVEQCVLSAIPVRPDTYYFAFENRGVLYQQMIKAQSISIYVPAGLKGLRLELLVVTA